MTRTRVLLVGASRHHHQLEARVRRALGARYSTQRPPSQNEHHGFLDIAASDAVAPARIAELLAQWYSDGGGGGSSGGSGRKAWCRTWITELSIDDVNDEGTLCIRFTATRPPPLILKHIISS